MMVEARLQQAAGAMPLPQSGFDAVVARVPPKAAPVRRFRPVLIVLAIVITLCGCTAAVTEYRKVQGMQPVLSSSVWWDAESQAEKYDLTLPETFDDHTFRSMDVMVLVPRYMHTLQAMFYPGYRPVGVVYASPTDDYAITVHFGSTADPYWMTCFGYESTDRWAAAGSYAVVEYAGHTIHTGETDYCWLKATWVDIQRGVCVSVSSSDGTDPLPLAKEIIDSSSQ